MIRHGRAGAGAFTKTLAKAQVFLKRMDDLWKQHHGELCDAVRKAFPLTIAVEEPPESPPTPEEETHVPEMVPTAEEANQGVTRVAGTLRVPSAENVNLAVS